MRARLTSFLESRVPATCICLLVLLGGCAQDRTRDETRDSNTLTVLYPVDEWGLGPAWSYPSQFLVFLPLVERNAQGELEGVLARRWEHSPDYREWTIHLRTDVRWHDGVPFTAHDVEFTLNLWAQDLGGAAPAGITVEVLDDSTYTLRLGGQSSGTPLDDYLVYYPKHLLEGLDPNDLYEWDFWTHPIGNGPYRFVNSIPKTMMELEANPDYFRGQPPIERVVLKFGESSLTELFSGNVDVLTYFNQLDIPNLVDDARYAVYYQANLSRAKAILWSHTSALFSDPKMRIALTMAIDRRELQRFLNLPNDAPVFDVIYTDRQLMQNALPAPVPHEREQAIRILEDLGWQDSDGDDIRDRQGEPLQFTALVTLGDWARGAEETAVYVQNELRRVGVRMDIEIQEESAGRERIRSGDFEAAISDITYNMHAEFFGADSPLGYRNPAVIDLIREARRTANPDVVDRVYRDLWAIFKDDLPVTFLFPAYWTTVANHRVRGLSAPYRAEPVWYMEHLWIEEQGRAPLTTRPPVPNP